MPAHSNRAVFASVVLVAACDAPVFTERGQIGLRSEDLRGFFVSGQGIAEQSVVCLDSARTPGDLLDDFDGDGDADIGACFDERLVGPASLDDEGCLVLDTPGIVDLEFERRPCPIDGDFGDDRLRFDVVAFSDLRGAFEDAVRIDAALLGRYDVVAEDPSATPGWLADVGGPLFVIEDLFHGVTPLAVRTDRPEAVAVTEPRAAATVVAGSPVFHFGSEPSAGVGVEAKAGDVFHVTLSLPGGTLDVGDVHVVARSDAAELVLAPSILRFADADAFEGLDMVGAEAVARDREGTILRQPPVSWSVVEGDVELERRDADDDGVEDPSWWTIIAADGCDQVEAGTWRSAILAGEMDDLRETVELRWQCTEGGDDGCACVVDGRGESPRAAVFLVVLVLLRGRGRRVRDR